MRLLRKGDACARICVWSAARDLIDFGFLRFDSFFLCTIRAFSPDRQTLTFISPDLSKPLLPTGGTSPTESRYLPFPISKLLGICIATMFELPSFSATPVAHVTASEPQCTLCQMIACPKLARDPDAGLVLSKQCAIHSAIVFVIVDYLWHVFQE